MLEIETKYFFQLKVVDRSIMPGDAVRRTNHTGNTSLKPQRGYVKKVNLMFDVAMLSNRNARLYSVPAQRFFGPVPFTVGCFCVFNFYLGEIEAVRNIIGFELRNGFVYEVKESLFRRYATDVHDKVEKQNYFHKKFFYSTQQVSVSIKFLKFNVSMIRSQLSETKGSPTIRKKTKFVSKNQIQTKNQIRTNQIRTKKQTRNKDSIR